MDDKATPTKLVRALETLEATLPSTEDPATSETRNMAILYVYRWVLQTAYGLLRQRVVSCHRDDVAHEISQTITLRRLCDEETLSRVVGARSPRRYLLGMIQNLIYDEYRKRQNRWEAGGLPLIDGYDVQDPRDSREVRDAAEAISFLWEEMTDKEKEFVHLRFWEDLSLRETADRLGIKYHAAAQRQKRLMDKLRAVHEAAES